MDLSSVRIFVVGPRQSGKTTFALQLRNELECCAWFDIGDALLTMLARTRAGTHDAEAVTLQRSYMQKHKEDFRQDLIVFGDILRELDPGLIIRHGFSKAPIVCGMRKREELRAYLESRSSHKENWPTSMIVIELTRDGCPEDNYELAGIANDPLFVCAYRIPNNGTLEDLRENAKRVAGLIKTVARQ